MSSAVQIRLLYMEQNTDLTNIPIEEHPFAPYLPANARVLLMGSFPPQPKRWSMDFYYPNRTNDFWPMMGLIFCGDRRALYSENGRDFDLKLIKQLLDEHGIALSDTGRKIRRLMNNASDKYLEIIEPVSLFELLARIPGCHTVGTTGEKAAQVVAQITGSEPPRMGECVVTPGGLHHWRLPSTSRAYPLALDKKAAYYAAMFRDAGLL